GRGPVHPPQHSLNMAIWPACSAVFVRSWGIKRYNWTMLFRGEDSSSSWLLIISSTDSFLRARESRSYVELRSGPVSANCNSPKYQTIVMYYNIYSYWNFAQPSSPGYITPFSFTLSDASVGTPCTGAPPYSATATATDGSGVTISATAQPSATIYYPSGNTLSPSLYWGGNPTTLTDTNGNQISGTVPSNRIITDTLGTTAIPAQRPGTPSSPVTFQYTNAAGTTSTVTVNYTAYTVQTNFGCSGITEYGPASGNLISEIDLPDGTKYTFSYELTPGSSTNV